MMIKLLLAWSIVSSIAASVYAFQAPTTVSSHDIICIASARTATLKRPITALAMTHRQGQDMEKIFHQPSNKVENDFRTFDVLRLLSSSSAALVVFGTALVVPTDAAWAAAPSAVSSALVAYSHYLFILVNLGLLMFERLTVKAGMTVDEEKSLVLADAAYGLSGVCLFVSGYFRVVEYGKGWDFYSHEPFFWLKLAFLGILAGSSLLPTIIFTKRGIPIFTGQTPLPPMSEAVAKRIRKVVNAEISAVLTIPLLATLMARGVGYIDNFPWQLGAALPVLTLGGTGYYYVRQALALTADMDRDSISSSKVSE